MYSQRIVEDKTAVFVVVPGKVYSHGADSQRIVEDRTAVLPMVPGEVYSHGADSQRIISYLAGMSPYISLKIKKRHYEHHMIEAHK
jgi:hypothetical protein